MSRVTSRRDLAAISAVQKIAAWQPGAVVRFPPGTYWLRRFANVPIASM
jgi:hypothetical protein